MINQHNSYSDKIKQKNDKLNEKRNPITSMRSNEQEETTETTVAACTATTNSGGQDNHHPPTLQEHALNTSSGGDSSESSLFSFSSSEPEDGDANYSITPSLPFPSSEWIHNAETQLRKFALQASTRHESKKLLRSNSAPPERLRRLIGKSSVQAGSRNTGRSVSSLPSRRKTPTVASACLEYFQQDFCGEDPSVSPVSWLPVATTDAITASLGDEIQSTATARLVTTATTRSGRVSRQLLQRELSIPPTRPADQKIPPVQQSQDSNAVVISELTKGNNARVLVEHSYTDRAGEDVGPVEDQNYQPRRVRGTTTPFPDLLYAVLQDPVNTASITWQTHGRAFRVTNQAAFVENVMPKYFRNSKFTSFQRQLSLYGFLRLTCKDNPDYGAYYHEFFLRGHPRLCRHITRKRVKGHAIRPTSKVETEPNLYQWPYCGAPAMKTNMAALLPPVQPASRGRSMATRAPSTFTARARTSSNSNPLPLENIHMSLPHGGAPMAELSPGMETDRPTSEVRARRPSIDQAAEALLLSSTMTMQDLSDWNPGDGWASTSSENSISDDRNADRTESISDQKPAAK